MNLRKRTQEEVDYSTDKLKDFTGGYEFLPWLIYMRLPYILAGVLGNLGMGIGILYSGDSDDWMTWVCGFFFVLASPFVFFMLVRDYKKLKKGETS